MRGLTDSENKIKEQTIKKSYTNMEQNKIS